ncbi:MAG: hypothetical protein PWR13_965 [Archaeoglobi archaeon]|nr:hypothetical protein [Archaeoglobi archaeon]
MLELFGVITGIVGTAVAIFSLYRQRKMEERLKHKEKLKQIAKKVEDIKSQLEYFLTILS